MTRFLPIFLVAIAGCSGSAASTPTEQTPTVAPEPAVECLPGCRPQGNVCATEASVLEGVRETIRQIECDPRCCDGQEQPASAVDADGDGIPDDADNCPQEPEDRDGFEDADGCPDPDNDQDGIPDNDDVCPLDKEDVDGFQDVDGCPD
ncbi:MAG: hypothetical protein R3E66_20805 [bacterium]